MGWFPREPRETQSERRRSKSPSKTPRHGITGQRAAACGFSLVFRLRRASSRECHLRICTYVAPSHRVDCFGLAVRGLARVRRLPLGQERQKKQDNESDRQAFAQLEKNAEATGKNVGAAREVACESVSYLQ